MKRRRHEVRLPLGALVALVALALGAEACTRNPYVIGSVCPTVTGVDVDPRCSTTVPTGGTLVVDFDRSGASALGSLELPTPVAPSLRLRGERATAAAWPTDGVAVLGRGAGVPAPGLPAPFTDETRAVALAADAPAYLAADATTGAVGADDLALEVVLRASAGARVLGRQGGAAGWLLHENAGGQLLLELGDGDPTHAATVASEPLTTGAWYHCLFWVSRAAGGRADCDGREGALVQLPALGTLDAPNASLVVGGGAATQVAHVALFRVAAGGLGAATSWLTLAARRFVTLAGAYPRFAGGTAAPKAGLRESEAYVDVQIAKGAPRRLFLVGADWPRVACRTDGAGTRDCGYLAEPYRTRAVPADASAWQAGAGTVAPSVVPFADGEPRFAALTATAAATTHALTFTGTAGGARQVFSFFVHADGATRVGASAGGLPTAVFDLATGTVVAQPAGAHATIEAWGDDIFRCAYVFDAAGGPVTYAVRLVDGAGNETFAGAAAAAVELAGLQVDLSLANAGSLLGANVQEADRLTFVAAGNLPTGTSAHVGMRVVLPAGTRLTDQAIVNFNLGGSFKDQVQLFVRGDIGRVKFWGLSGGATRWTFDGVPSVIDGVRHTLEASWDAASARLVIDASSAGMPVMTAAPPLAPDLDRIDVGFSESSSGALEGLVAGLVVGAM